MRKKKSLKSEFPSPDDAELPVPNNEDAIVIPKKKHNKLGWWNKRKLKKNADRSFLIKFFFSNGTCKEFVIVGKAETFMYRKRCYYLRYEDCWFNLTQNQFELDFHDDCAVPIKREIHKEGDEAFFSVSPDNLKPLIKMEYVKALATSDDVIKLIKATLVISMASAFLSLIGVFIAFSSRGLVKKLIGLG